MEPCPSDSNLDTPFLHMQDAHWDTMIYCLNCGLPSITLPIQPAQNYIKMENLTCMSCYRFLASSQLETNGTSTSKDTILTLFAQERLSQPENILKKTVTSSKKVGKTQSKLTARFCQIALAKQISWMRYGSITQETTYCITRKLLKWQNRSTNQSPTRTTLFLTPSYRARK